VETLTAFLPSLSSASACRIPSAADCRRNEIDLFDALRTCVAWATLSDAARAWQGSRTRADQRRPTESVPQRLSARGALAFALTRDSSAWPAARLGHNGDRVAIYDAGPSCSLAVRTTASGVNPNFDCRALRGADAPNVDIATTAPVDPT